MRFIRLNKSGLWINLANVSKIEETAFGVRIYYGHETFYDEIYTQEDTAQVLNFLKQQRLN